MSLWKMKENGRQVTIVKRLPPNLLVKDTQTNEQFVVHSSELESVYQKYANPIETPQYTRPDSPIKHSYKE